MTRRNIRETTPIIPGSFPSNTVLPHPSIDEELQYATPEPHTPLLSMASTPDLLGSPSARDNTIARFLHLHERPDISTSQSDSAVEIVAEYRKHKRWIYNEQQSPSMRLPPKKRAVSNPEHGQTRSHTASNSCNFIPRRPMPRTQGTREQERHANGMDVIEIDTNSLKSPKNPLEIHAELRAKVRQEMKYDHSKGHVYILRDKKHPERLKIGATDNVTRRATEIERHCGLTLEIIHTSKECKNRVRAEQLIHIDLSQYNQPFRCPDNYGTTHREWYIVPVTQAKETVDRWVDFIHSEPYTHAGTLKDIWNHVITERTSKIHNTFESDHHKRWQSWKMVIRPLSPLEYITYECRNVETHPIWLHLWQYIWQVCTVLYALFYYIAISNTLSFGLFASLVGCACVSISGGLRPGRIVKSPRSKDSPS